MTDLIDRQAVVNVICEMHVGGQDAVKNALPNTYGADLREIIEEIDALPSADAVEVVRCKDCKYNPKDAWFGCPMSHMTETQKPDTAWCWKGERKDGNV